MCRLISIVFISNQCHLIGYLKTYSYPITITKIRTTEPTYVHISGSTKNVIIYYSYLISDNGINNNSAVNMDVD